MAGWGGFLGKLFDLIPGRKESMLNRIKAIKEDMHEIQTKKGKLLTRDVIILERLSSELSVLQDRIGNYSG